MLMPTWLFGRRSVTTETSAAIRVSSRKSTDGPVSGQPQGGWMLGVGHGLARTDPVPGSGGMTMFEMGVGVGGLSPGSLVILVVSARYQLLLGPATTPAGLENQRLPGTPARAWSTNLCTPGEATNTPSEPARMKCRLSRMSPTQRPTAMSGVNAIVAASLKLSVVPVFAATMRLDQWSALLQPKIRHRFWSSAMIWAMMYATAGSIAWRARCSGW